jgi:V8-like Glu-specific endopeptidase
MQALARYEHEKEERKLQAIARIWDGVYGILEKDETDKYVFVGVAVAITKKHLLTAYHNIVVLADDEVESSWLSPVEIMLASEGKTALSSATSSSSASVPSLTLKAEVVGGDEVDDWAVLKIEGESLQPVPVVMENLAYVTKTVMLVTLHTTVFYEANDVKLTAAQSVQECTISTALLDKLQYNVSVFKGHSGSPLVICSDGRLCGIHIAQINNMSVPRPIPPKTSKKPRCEPALTDVQASHEDLRKTVQDIQEGASGSMAHVAEALRIDYILEKLKRMCDPYPLVGE